MKNISGAQQLVSLGKEKIMTGKGRFHIPTSEEMEQDASTKSVKSLFQSHQANVKSNIKNKTPAEESFSSKPTTHATGQQKSTTGVSSGYDLQNYKLAAVHSASVSNNQISSTAGSSKNINSSGSVKVGRQDIPANGTLPSKQLNNHSQSNTFGNKKATASTTHTEIIGPQSNTSSTGLVSKPAENVSRTDSTSTKLVSGTAAPSASVTPPVKSATPVTPPRPGGNASSLIVSARQRGNPVLKFIRNVPWEYGDIIPDYVMGQTSCALFLSLRYHQLNNNYIHERLKQLGHSFNLRVLLVQVDIKDPHHCLKELAKICLLSDCTLILAWSPEEAGRYLETYKSFENKPPDLIMEKTETNFIGRVSDFFTSARKVNKTDAMTLMSTFGTVADVIQASEEDMSLCPGFGPQKAKRLNSIFHEPFLKAKKQKTGQIEQGQGTGKTPQGTSSKQR